MPLYHERSLLKYKAVGCPKQTTMGEFCRNSTISSAAKATSPLRWTEHLLALARVPKSGFGRGGFVCQGK